MRSLSFSSFIKDELSFIRITLSWKLVAHVDFPIGVCMLVAMILRRIIYEVYDSL